MFMLTISKHCVIKCKTAVKSIFLFRNMKMFYLLDKKNITFLSCHIYGIHVFYDHHRKYLKWPANVIFDFANEDLFLLLFVFGNKKKFPINETRLTTLFYSNQGLMELFPNLFGFFYLFQK